jgi:hypothetical protein
LPLLTQISASEIKYKAIMSKNQSLQTDVFIITGALKQNKKNQLQTATARKSPADANV